MKVIGSNSIATWTSSTAADTPLAIDVSNYAGALITYTKTGTVSAGTINFEFSDDDGTTWRSIEATNVASFASATSYALTTASAAWIVNCPGATDFRVRLSIQISGAGSASLRIANLAVVTPFPGTGGGGGGGGDASAANQDLEIAALNSIDGKTPALGQALAAASVPVVLTAAQVSTLTPPAAITGFATSGKQDTGNTSLASIDTKVPALGQALAAASTPVVLTAAQVSTLTPPAAITGFALESGGNLATIASDLGAKTDAKNTATDTTSVSIVSILKQISASVQAPPSQAVTNAGTFAAQAAITAASGSIASGAIASGAIASGALASGSIADGASVTLGAKADAKSTATDTTSITIMQVLKQISASVQAPPSQAVTNAGTFAVQNNSHGKTVVSTGGSAASNGNNTLVVAGTNKIKVSKFSLSTTSTTAMTCIFQSGASGTELWRCIIQAPSGASSGANLAVPIPDWIFATASATLLNLNLSSANAVHWALTYVDEA